MTTINLLGAPCAYDLSDPKPDLPVLVFVHGWLLSRAYWQPLVATLSDRYQCLTYDLRGFGQSRPLTQKSTAESPIYSAAGSAETQSYSLQAYAQDLVTLLKALNISQACLVGHSLGGSVALWAAALAPEIVQGVICVNAGGGIYLQTEFERFRSAGQQLVKFRPNWLRYAPFVDRAFGQMAVCQPIDRRWAKQRVIDFLEADAVAARQSLLDSTTPDEVHRLPQLVAELKQPVYFIAGCQDPVMEPKYVRHLASFHFLFRDHGENVLELENCGHLAMLEQTERVAQHVQRIVPHLLAPMLAH
jgi:2-succinyl-6-hydroxy-2,4-cyclohexadiene-1-carboxylate synthase